jgi:GTP-binding protein HflX
MIEKNENFYENLILIGIINSKQDKFKVSDYLEELAFLAKTAGGNVIK